MEIENRPYTFARKEVFARARLDLVHKRTKLKQPRTTRAFSLFDGSASK